MYKKALSLFVAFVLSACGSGPALATTSGIDPSVPAANSAMSSAPIRANFAAAYADVNALYSRYDALGTISTQAANNVEITGGTIDAVSIGSNEAAFGRFSLINTIGDGAVNFEHTGEMNFQNIGSINFNNTDTINFTNSGFMSISPSDGLIIDPLDYLNILPLGKLTITSGSSVGDLDKMNIGQTTPGKGNFTEVKTTTAVRGTFTANGTSAVTVTNANITANSVIEYGLKTVGGTPACKPFESAVTVGVGFDVKACTGDTSVYNYTIIN